jgi:outer membrane protein OmpA-like peptidoglycan-associated protein
MQTAALAPEAAAAIAGPGKRDLRIAFSGEAATLTDPAKGEIKQLAGALAKDQALRIQVKAYASGKEDASKARRLSLSRALAVRSYLIEQGIGSTRIDVRALGNTAEGGPSDRVDLVVVTR